jgi:hypothetical protein
LSVMAAGPELLAPVPTPAAIPTVVLPVATPTPIVPTPAPTSTDAQVWQALQPQLDAAWGSDTPRTVAILDEFLARFPDYEAAREKLYAALVASGRDLVDGGDSDQAVDPLERARLLFPTRGEAVDELTSLTPTPEPAAARPVQPAPAPAARPASGGAVASAPPPVPARPPAPAPPTPAPPPVVQVAAPTPTKVPFAPPRSP